MKKHNLVSLMFLAPIVMWAQAVQVEPALSDIDLSDVVIIEDVAEPVESTRADTGKRPSLRKSCPMLQARRQWMV